VADAFRQEWGRITAALIYQTGDWDLAEECAQDAFTQALRRSPRDGVPNRPGAWLMTVTRNGAIDRLRRSSTYPCQGRGVGRHGNQRDGNGQPGARR
jgi:RNA polymerase sigma-70 factor (ECF subfamily)